ncbi:MAG: rRNA maturation RNase YbeY [Bryobacterales bacterium]|nr:rRNA maturation RNase YbeY [Bryobacterales bacterium]
MSDPDHRRIPRRVVFRGRYQGLARTSLQAFADQLSQQVLDGKDFACLVTNDEEMAALNGQYRKKPEPTDVLSFPSPSAAGDEYAGDIAISIQHARQQARALGHSPEDEVRVLMLHGALHLDGLDHEQDDGAMRRAEQRWRKRFGLPVTLIARSR